ncbi:hypothetical protein CNMCM8980_010199 [Aspergillus fumigatiaffinis]|nr:hypothetical protein CNMCM8980_010199 [Aspergillus fumigatiaffinis]
MKNTLGIIFLIFPFFHDIFATAIPLAQATDIGISTEDKIEETVHLSDLLNADNIDPGSVCTGQYENDGCTPFFKTANKNNYESFSIPMTELRLFFDMAHNENSHESFSTIFNQLLRASGLDSNSEGLLTFNNASDLLRHAFRPSELHSGTWKRQAMPGTSLKDFAIMRAAAMVASDLESLSAKFSQPVRVVRGISNCDSTSRSIVDSCKRGVRTQVAGCKQKLKDDIATCKNDVGPKIDKCKREVSDRVASCKDKVNSAVAECMANVGRTIDKCKKKKPLNLGTCEAQRPFLKAGCAVGKLGVPSCEFGRTETAACEAKRGGLLLKCETDRINIPLCEFDRLTATCCEGTRDLSRSMCRAGFSVEAIQQEIQKIQARCAIATAIAKSATKSYLSGQAIGLLSELKAVKEVGDSIQMVNKLQKTQKELTSIANGVIAAAEGRINDADSLLSSLKGLPAPVSNAESWAKAAQAVINGKIDSALGSACGAVAELQAIKTAVDKIEKLKSLGNDLKKIQEGVKKCALANHLIPANFRPFQNLRVRSDINRALSEYRKLVEAPLKQLAECKAVGQRIDRLIKASQSI